MHLVWNKKWRFSVYLPYTEQYHETFGVLVNNILTFSGYHSVEKPPKKLLE
jgi:hypothetical protein